MQVQSLPLGRITKLYKQAQLLENAYELGSYGLLAHTILNLEKATGRVPLLKEMPADIFAAFMMPFLGEMDECVLTHLIRGDLWAVLYGNPSDDRERVRAWVNTAWKLATNCELVTTYIRAHVDNEGRAPSAADYLLCYKYIGIYLQGAVCDDYAGELPIRPDDEVTIAYGIDCVADKLREKRRNLLQEQQPNAPAVKGPKSQLWDLKFTEEGYRRYLLDENVGPSTKQSPTPRVKIREYCNGMAAVMRGVTQQNEPLERPLTYAGHAEIFLNRLADHEEHCGSPRIMRVMEATFIWMFETGKVKKRYTMDTLPLGFATSEGAAPLAECTLSRLSQCYSWLGGGFATYPAGGNTTVDVSVEQYQNFDNLVKKHCGREARMLREGARVRGDSATLKKTKANEVKIQELKTKLATAQALMQDDEQSKDATDMLRLQLAFATAAKMSFEEVVQAMEAIALLE